MAQSLLRFLTRLHSPVQRTYGVRMTSQLAPVYKLNNGYKVPVLGLGTWQSKPGEVTAAVIDAIEAGYRHIDCARVYENEADVGAGIRTKIDDGSVQREDLFVVSKLWDNAHRPDCVLPAIKTTLNDLGLNYLDLYLIHSPMGLQPLGPLIPLDQDGNPILDNETDLVDTWKEMEKLVKLGLTKSIGISNFNSKQVEYILQNCIIPPATNQIEMHPYLIQTKLVEFCQSRGVSITAYSPFGSPSRPHVKLGDPNLLEEPKLVELARKHGKGPNHIILRWLYQKGVITIPKSVTKHRIIDNFNIFNFILSEDDMEQVETLNIGGAARTCCEPHMKNSKYYPFDLEF